MRKSELINAFRQEGECIVLDFNNPNHSAWLLELYGGKEYMEHHLPALYGAYRQAIELPKQNVKAPIGLHNDLWVAHFKSDNTGKAINGQMIASLTEDALLIDENIFVRKMDNTVMIDLFKTKLDSYHSSTSFAVPCSFTEKDDQYKIDCTVLWVEQQSGILQGMVYSCDLYPLTQSENSTKEIQINHPVKKNPQATPPIKICYNRQWLVHEQVDYPFDELLNPKTGVQRLYAPLNFKVYFEDCKKNIDRILPKSIVIKMDCKKGTATYDYDVEKRPEAVKMTPFTGGFTITLDPDWNVDVPASRLPIRDRVDMFVYMKYILTDGTESSIQIDSYDQTVPSSNHAKVGWINLLWGCLGRGTNVLYADGSSQPIERVMIGDRIICSTQGHIARVENVLRGMEPEMTNIQAEDNSVLSCTADHPIITPQGPKRADEVCGSDLLINQHGEYLHIKGVWNTGECEVYNLMLDFIDGNIQPDWGMFCNGILVGDNHMQNNLQCSVCNSLGSSLPFALEQQAKQDLWAEKGEFMYE